MPTGAFANADVAINNDPQQKSPSGEGLEGGGVASRQPPITPDQNLALMRV
jgi:hypothetical protein